MDVLLAAVAEQAPAEKPQLPRTASTAAVDCLAQLGSAPQRRVGLGAHLSEDDATELGSMESVEEGVSVVSPPGRQSPTMAGLQSSTSVLSLLSLSAPQAGSTFGGRKPRARSFDMRGDPVVAKGSATKRPRSASCVTPPEPAVDAGRSKVVDGVPKPLDLDAPSHPLLYEDLINYPRTRGKAHARRCVMCGRLASGTDAACSIPLQNKDVCKRCDTGIWHHEKTKQHFKWCKGCKKFLHAHFFREKLLKCATKYAKQPSKCDKCRERGRQSYMSKRIERDQAKAAAAGDADAV
jgi:hypothetical protein